MAFPVVTYLFIIATGMAAVPQLHGASADGTCGAPNPSALPGIGSLQEMQAILAAAKEKSGRTYSQIAKECNLTNVYAAQLFQKQAQLKGGPTEECLKRMVPELQSHPQLVQEMKKPPARRFDPSLIQEPLVYRFYEAVMHYGEAMRAIVNEEFGDGIMSAIDFYVTIDRLKGKSGEARVVVTMNGKYLPFVEQSTEDNVAQLESEGN